MNVAVEEPAATMREVLASLPGFSLKSSRRRSTKRLSATAQLEAGLVDLESPASILASTSLRALLNRHTFQGLPPLYQRKLAQLLPAVDRQVCFIIFEQFTQYITYVLVDIDLLRFNIHYPYISYPVIFSGCCYFWIE